LGFFILDSLNRKRPANAPVFFCSWQFVYYYQYLLQRL
jgi:hypothetical protein